MTKLSAVRASPRVTDGSVAGADVERTADVCGVGSGAGGAVAAATLAAAGIDVLVVEEGGYFSHADFTMKEAEVGPKLYQEATRRTTADAAIALMQGRAVGGTTVVNWTTCFRTPEDVVDHWARRHEVRGFSYADLVPHYERIEERLAVRKVDEPSMNRNNKKLFEGCKALGWHVDTTRRNVYSCMQTGACGMGCPINAKRSMLVTMIPDAIDAGARLLFRCRIDRLETAAGEVRAATGTLLDAGGYAPTGRRARIRARRFVLAGGAVNTPALLLRSGMDEGGRAGVRTFLHPTVVSLARYDEPIEPYYGAPQSAASHEFSHRGGDVGFFMEAAPGYPSAMAVATPGFGEDHAGRMASLSRTAIHIALAIDGFHEGAPGGVVRLRPSGAPVLDYPIPPRVWESLRTAQKRLAELQLASGAREVLTLHEPARPIARAAEIGSTVDALPWEPGRVGLFSAHLMGGCAMGDDPSSSVVRSEDLRAHRWHNLWVMDGSVFPTSLGVNPQESIYGLVSLMASRLAGAARSKS